MLHGTPVAKGGEPGDIGSACGDGTDGHTPGLWLADSQPQPLPMVGPRHSIEGGPHAWRAGPVAGMMPWPEPEGGLQQRWRPVERKRHGLRGWHVAMTNQGRIQGTRHPIRRIVCLCLILLLTAAVGVYVSVRIHWSRRIDRQLAAMKAVGLPTTLAELNRWYRLPDGVIENAADTYLDAFACYVEPNEEDADKVPASSTSELPGRRESLPGQTQEAMARLVAGNKRALTLLHEAADIPACRYPIDLRKGQAAAVIKALTLPEQQRLPAVVTLESEQRKVLSSNHVLLDAVRPRGPGYCLHELSGLAQIRAARTALAVERYRLKTGSLPASLEGLVPGYLATIPLDPFTREPLKFRQLARGYVVYSVGRDLSDDGGKEKPAKGDGPYDVTFTVER
jgi:hypothetical protein